MEVQELIELIKENSPGALKKGSKIFFDSHHEIEITDSQDNFISLEVPSQSTNDSYTVQISYEDEMIMESCDCPAFDTYYECKHCVAGALFLLHKQYKFTVYQLQQLLKANGTLEVGKIIKQTAGSGVESPAKVVALVPKQNNGEWESFIQPGKMAYYFLQIQSGYYYANRGDIGKISLIEFDEPGRHWKFLFRLKANEFYYPEIKFDSEDSYSYRCACGHSAGIYPMCKHVRTAFDLLITKNGENYFLRFKDWTKQKNELLKAYGLTTEDEEAKLFEFQVDYYDRLQVKAPVGFYKADDLEGLKKLSHTLKATGNNEEYVLRPKPLSTTVIDFEVGFVLNLKSKRLGIGFELELAKVYNRQGKKDLKKLNLNTAVNRPLLRQLTDEQYNLFMNITDEKLVSFLKSKGHAYVGNYSNPFNNMGGSTITDLSRHYVECIIKLWPHLTENENVFLLEEGNYSNKNCKPVKLSANHVELSFEIIEDGKFITIWLIPVFGNMAGTTPEDKVVSFFNFLFSLNSVLHVLKNMADIVVIEQFANGFIKVPVSQKLQLIKTIVGPLQQKYEVRLPPQFAVETIEAELQPQVLLKEFNDQFLMLQPQFLYGSELVDYSADAEDVVLQKEDGSLLVIKRNSGKEKQFFETLRPLHDSFNRQYQNDFFYVHFNEVMKGNWFLNTVRYLQENDFVVKGMENLKRFRYNTNKPKWEMKTGSGIDWFDLKIKVSFGDEEVAFKDIRKAIISNQNIVVLGDGTFGVLPEEWLQQYSMLFKMGEAQKDDSIRLNKLHFTLIDQLHEQITDEAILNEIAAKKEKLKNIENVKTVKHSKNIKAKLRPYQLSGFQWMQTLDELGWGGCLADDMGLGKTLQAITFLQFLKEKYKGSTHLVVCPTSLIYNWETEIKKFAPKLKYHIYYGSSREFTEDHFEDYDIVITSYGLVRNDMEQMMKFNWHYIILDESQSIKNPEAQVTKAVQLLKAKNRLVLSGTPVQNNTFDLYAQFNFINPGILGNKEFYKTEFANPIDKNNDTEKIKALRQLIYPFLLRRTKEQVAKDLPDKTETILWCSMGKEQQNVYDDYKNYYRKMLMKKIEEEGMAKAGMYVLEGLLRLRQICDSPQLIKDAEVTTKKSIKIEELIRELEENTGSHKLLVFSQFTEMLQLIKEELQKKKIVFSYLDGSTPAAKRKEAVDNFQADEKIKVFLISLKAGGVGLNLTAADYVYIVDPWWNPAVEQQAIDRTHRIGQTKKIFAYKMICKDTVEEKIVELQKRKKQIASDLVTEDAGFIKKLSRDDVEFLFS